MPIYRFFLPAPEDPLLDRICAPPLERPDEEPPLDLTDGLVLLPLNPPLDLTDGLALLTPDPPLDRTDGLALLPLNPPLEGVLVERVVLFCLTDGLLCLGTLKLLFPPAAGALGVTELELLRRPSELELPAGELSCRRDSTRG